MPTIKKGDFVRVDRCQGIARVEKVSRKDKVVYLNHQMSMCFPGDGDTSVDTFVSYWTFPVESLSKIDIGGRNE
jgi:hypothetical protein